MRYCFLTLLLFCINVSADPFFGVQKLNHHTQESLAKNSENLTACKPSENQFSVNIATEFEKLKLVGLIKINDRFRALFIDEKDHVFAVTENELINHHIEIKNINLKSLTYINWKLTQECNIPYEITLKL